MNLFANNSGSAGAYQQGIYNYGPADLKVAGNSAVGTSMTFEPNSYVYTSQTAPKVLKYYEASTLKQWPIAYGTTSAILTANVTTFSLQSDTKFYVVCKTLNASYNQTSIAKIQITGTGTSSAYLTDLSSKTGQYLQVGFVMEGVTKTDAAANNGKVVLTIQNRSVVATAPPYPATTENQLLRNGNFNLSTDTNYNFAVPPLPDTTFWQAFEGAYVGKPEYVTAPDSPTPGANALILQGQPYAGAWYNGNSGIDIFANGGGVFTLTFNAFFPADYSATSTSISFFNYTTLDTIADVNINSQIGSGRGSWQNYSVRFVPTSAQFEALKTGKLKFKVQTDGRVGTALFNNFILRQQSTSEIGPQISTIVSGNSQNNNSSYNFTSPLIGKSTAYSVQLANTGAENLTVSSISLSGTSFALLNATTPMIIAPGGSQSFSITASPTSLSLLSGTLTVNSNDKETADRVFIVNLTASPVNLSDSFNGSESPSQLGWVPSSSRAGILTSSTTTVSGGAMQINIDSSTGDYPWSYALSKTFASPGTLDLATSSLLVSLKASGVFGGMTQNKVQVRLESLNSALAVTGSIQLGSWVDETSPANYFTGDGINDRVVILVPEGGSSFTEAGGTLASTGVKSASFDTGAPYFRLVVQATDFEFDNDNNNVIELNSVILSLGVSPFTLTNGSFESDSTDVGTGSAPTSWFQYPTEGVSKNTLANGAKIYNQTTKDDDASTVSSAFAGTKVMKVYGQNYYPGGVWQGPSQTGTIYQEFPVNTTPSLIVGATIHARGMAKVFSIDPLTSTSTFNYGFKYVDQGNNEIGRSVTTLTSANFSANNWVPLTVNGTVPVGTAKVQLISEFVQTSSSGNGAVYLDDLSIGFGTISPTAIVGASTYSLVWSDEFDGTALNTANWTPETGGGGWGNNEQQTYTSDSANLRVDSGNLIIQAVKSGSAWTSARIKSQDKRSFQYGKIEFRAKLPTGIGPWPAAWLLGNNFSTAGWPACGEIDVMEWRGNPTSDANTVGHALHSSSRNGSNPVQPTSRSAVVNPSSQFHTYAVVWTSSGMTFSVDGVDKATLTPPTADAAAFQKEFFLLLNLAMGGSYVGNTISSSLTSASYEVDYVRVYQTASATVTAPATPATPTFSSVSSTGFTVNWVAVSGATSYRLDVSTSSTFASYFTQDLTVSGTSQAVTGLSPGTTYYARVRAVNSGGTSASSSNGTQATTASAPSVPATPSFSSVSSTGFTVNWVAVSGATSYRLDVSTSSTFATYFTQDLTVSGTSQAVTGLSPGTTYYARVRAVNSGGTSASSSNGTQATLTSYQQYLSGLGLSTSTAFDADANGDGIKEGIKYAFNAASPQLGSSPATITRSGNTLTYTFDIRSDTALSTVVQLSTNLTSWTSQASSVITNGTGAAAGYTRKIVTITTTEPKAFIRLQVTVN